MLESYIVELAVTIGIPILILYFVGRKIKRFIVKRRLKKNDN